MDRRCGRGAGLCGGRLPRRGRSLASLQERFRRLQRKGGVCEGRRLVAALRRREPPAQDVAGAVWKRELACVLKERVACLRAQRQSRPATGHGVVLGRVPWVEAKRKDVPVVCYGQAAWFYAPRLQVCMVGVSILLHRDAWIGRQAPPICRQHACRRQGLAGGSLAQDRRRMGRAWNEALRRWRHAEGVSSREGRSGGSVAEVPVAHGFPSRIGQWRDRGQFAAGQGRPRRK